MSAVALDGHVVEEKGGRKEKLPGQGNDEDKGARGSGMSHPQHTLTPDFVEYVTCILKQLLLVKLWFINA